MYRRRITPADHPAFVQAPVFTRCWAGLRLADGDLIVLEHRLMHDPTAGAVVRGAGGVRKIRFAPPGWGTGKSGAVRVYYTHVSWLRTVVLLFAHDKGTAETLTPAGVAVVRGLAERIEEELRVRHSQRGRIE